MDELIQQRGASKAQITRVENWYEANKNNIYDKNQLQNRLDIISTHLSKYNDIQDQIENSAAAPTNPEDRDLFENKALDLISQLQTHIALLTLTISPAADTHLNTHNSKIRLPNIQISTFSGNCT